MAKRGYISPDGTARKTAKIYLGDANCLARRITKAYLGDKNGVAREWFSSSVPISTLPVGSSVFMNVDGVRTEFLVVHQGLPRGNWYGTADDENSYSYDGSCNGTWLLMRDVYPVEVKYYDGNEYLSYEDSTMHSYLTNTFFYLLDSNIQAIVKQVNRPQQYGGTFQAKVFLLSAYELGVYEDESSSGDPFPPMSGRKLDYFIQDMYLHNQNTAAYEQRKCYNNGTPAVYPTSTTWNDYSEEDEFTYREYWCVGTSGAFTRRYVNYGTVYMETPRPAMILPPETLVDGNFNVIA